MTRTKAVMVSFATIGYMGIASAQNPADMFKAMSDAVKKVEQQEKQSSSSNGPAPMQPQQPITNREPKSESRTAVANSGTPEPSKTAKTVPDASATPLGEIDLRGNRNPQNDKKILTLVSKSAEQACKGHRWLGLEDGRSCGINYILSCARAINEFSHHPQGCYSSLPPFNEIKIDWIIRHVEKEEFDKPIKKEAILEAAPTRLDIDKKLAHVEKVCEQMFVKLDSTAAVAALASCNTRLGAASLGAEWARDNSFGACNGEFLGSNELKKYCHEKLISWAGGIRAKLKPAYVALQKNEIDAYMSSGSVAQAKKKLDSVMAEGDRNIASLKGWCKKLQGPLELNAKEFLPKCETYVELKADSLTGGQASRDAQASAKAKEMNDALHLAYLSHMMVKACYESRKEFEIQYITKGQFDQASQHKDIAESNLLKQGANKELAYKRASDQFSPMKDSLTATQSNYSESRKRSCEEGVSVLRLLGQKAN
jgi:hypothetical protein